MTRWNVRVLYFENSLETSGMPKATTGTFESLLAADAISAVIKEVKKSLTPQALVVKAQVVPSGRSFDEPVDVEPLTREERAKFKAEHG